MMQSRENLEEPHLPWSDVEPSLIPNQYVFDVQGSDADPLEAELGRLCAAKDNVIKAHEDTRQRLECECDKEIAEMIAQINPKYEAKHEEAEAAFQSRKKEVDMNLNRVVMNKKLAEAFRCMCQEQDGVMGMQQLLRFSSRPPPKMKMKPSPSTHSTMTNSMSMSMSPRPRLMSVGSGSRAPAPHIRPFRPDFASYPSQHVTSSRMQAPAPAPVPVCLSDSDDDK